MRNSNESSINRNRGNEENHLRFERSGDLHCGNLPSWQDKEWWGYKACRDFNAVSWEVAE